MENELASFLTHILDSFFGSLKKQTVKNVKNIDAVRG
jgi:hypothetical protein